MKAKQKPFLVVEQLPNGPKVFVLDDLRFDRLPSNQVIDALPRGTVPIINVRVQRGDKEFKGMVALHSPHMNGGGYTAISIFGAMHVLGINASEFEVGDKVYFDTPKLNLRSTVVDRWYSIKLFESPWKERNQELYDRHVEEVVKLERKMESGEINEQEFNKSFDAANRRCNVENKEFFERFHREVSLPSVLFIT